MIQQSVINRHEHDGIEDTNGCSHTSIISTAQSLGANQNPNCVCSFNFKSNASNMTDNLGDKRLRIPLKRRGESHSEIGQHGRHLTEVLSSPPSKMSPRDKWAASRKLFRIVTEDIIRFYLEIWALKVSIGPVVSLLYYHSDTT